jgi:transposase
MLDRAQDAPETVILAEDEATLYLQATTTAVWAPKGEYPPVRVDAGRSKTHFYGTLNLQTGTEIVTRSERMTSESTAKHLQTLLDAYPDQPMLLLWDRAPWHRGAAVQQVLGANPRLEILFFPTASPDRNPQEHVWKATRLAVSHNHQVSHLPRLADQFAAYLRSHLFPSTFLKKYGYCAIYPMFI